MMKMMFYKLVAVVKECMEMQGEAVMKFGYMA